MSAWQQNRSTPKIENPSDVDALIENFAQYFGRSPTPEELAALYHARELLAQRQRAEKSDWH